MNSTLSNPGHDIKLPHSPDAERALLGCVLLAPAWLEWVSQHLSVDDFYLASHRLIFRAFLDLMGTTLDVVTVADLLRQKGELEKVGGVSYLASLT
jgi:replicative DNA helicase